MERIGRLKEKYHIGSCFDIEVKHENNVTKEYLSKVLIPLVFLSKVPLKGGDVTEYGIGPGGYANFFAEKIKSGEFQISELNNATLAYYFPEFSMNFNELTNKEWDDANNEINHLIMDQVNEIIESYIFINFPGKKHLPQIKRFFKWKNYVTDIYKKCQDSTGTGLRVMRDNEGNVIYKEHLGMVSSQTEKIPYDDMRICFTPDEGKGKFSCHSLKDILRAIAISKSEENSGSVLGRSYDIVYYNMKMKYVYLVVIILF